jgi:hypothetical protein
VECPSVSPRLGSPDRRGFAKAGCEVGNQAVAHRLALGKFRLRDRDLEAGRETPAASGASPGAGARCFGAISKDFGSSECRDTEAAGQAPGGRESSNLKIKIDRP